MGVRLERRHLCREYLPLILKSIAFEHTSDDLDTLPHHCRWTNFLAFSLTNLFHEDLRRAQAQQKTVSGQILHHARFHRNLHWMTRVRRDDPPSELDAARLRGNYRQDCRRRACLKRMLAPPGICF